MRRLSASVADPSLLFMTCRLRWKSGPTCVCPWCYIGKRRFEAALEHFEHRDEVTVMWRSFELDPEAAREPMGTAAERLAGKYGMTPRARQGTARRDDRARRGRGPGVPPGHRRAAGTPSTRTG